MMRMLLAAALVAAPAPAFSQGLFGLGAKPKPDAEKQTGCNLSEGKKRGSSVAGSVLGGLAGSFLGGRAGSVASFVPLNTLTTMLTDAIACKLDEDEQKKAAAATNDALARGAGSTSSWTSTTRQNVSGTSTVTAQQTVAGGGTCMTVNDVIIVEGEETTVSKRMCRVPPATGYSIAQA